MSRDRLRSLTVGAPKHFKSEIVRLAVESGKAPRLALADELPHVEIIPIEVRQLSAADHEATVKQATAKDGSVSASKLSAAIIIASCYEPATVDGKPAPGGTVKLYDPADRESIEAQPVPCEWVEALVAAYGRVGGRGSVELGKGSVMTAGDSSSSG